MKTNDITLSAILLALLIVLSQLSVPIGPVPITLQTLAVLLIGYFLSAKNAALVGFIYLIGGLLGLPIFSGFQGGLQSVLYPSFGFILSFIPAAYLQAKYLEKTKASKTTHLFVGGIINFIVTYFIGLTYMALILNIYLGSQLTFTGILMAGFIPFIPGDILKLIMGTIIAKRIIPFIKAKSVTI